MTSMLTDSANKRAAAEKAEELKQLRQKRLALVAKRNHRSDEVKIETIKTYLALGGNLTLTSASTGIAYTTLKVWKASAWWNTVITELRKEEKLLLSTNTKKLMKVAMEALADRVENGNHIYDQKKGKLIRKPLEAKDLHKISVDLIDRAQVLDKATEETVNIQNDEDKLSKLAERFAALALKAAERQANINTGEVVDIQSKEITEE